jgi:hypothetical protein
MSGEASGPGYVLHTDDRAIAAMQLAAHFTQEAMQHSRAGDARARLAEQLGSFDLAFRAIMGSTGRGIAAPNAAGPTNHTAPVMTGGARTDG